MLKYLAIAILIAIVMPIYGQEKGSQPSGNQSNSNSSQNVTAAPSGTVTCVVKQEGTAIECKWTKDIPESKLRRLFSPENAPNIGLFFVGLGGVIAAVFTLLAINKQAKLMEGQLAEMKAARDVESTILVLQYRPKIIVRGAIAFDFNSLEVGVPTKGTARFAVRNIGGTAARITECRVRMFTADAGAQIELKEGEEVHIGQFTLQPGQEIQIERVLTTGAINSIEWGAFYRGERTDPYKILYLTGTIRYLDDIDIPRQTSFYRSYDAKERKFVPSKNTDDEYTD